MSFQFEWDAGKARSNVQKHEVSFEEAISVFSDPLARIVDDVIHSTEEQREIIIGHSDRSHLLFVCFTERARAIRILGARRATRKERQDYEENANV